MARKILARLRSARHGRIVRWTPLLVLAAGWWLEDPDSVIRVLFTAAAFAAAVVQPRCYCHERAELIEAQMSDWDAAFSAIMPDGGPPRGKRMLKSA